MFYFFSVYEVYVKEETAGSEGRNDVTVVPSLPSTNDHQLIQVIMNGELTINFPLLTVIINNVTYVCVCNFLHHKYFVQRFGLICFQGDCMNLNVAIDSEVINIDGAVTKFLGKDAFKYKVKN